MALKDDFFAGFPPVSKEEWLLQVAKDLKGRPLEELDWQAADDLKVSPFAHADDFDQMPALLSNAPNNWEICEDVFVTDPATGNRQAMEALEGGAEGLRFHFPAPPDTAFMEQLLAGVYLDFIGLHFAGPGMAQNPGAILGHLERLAKQKNLEPQQLRGSFGYDPAASAGIVDWRYLTELAEFAGEKFPGFKLVTVASNASVPETPAAALGTVLHRGNRYLQKLTERGLSAAEAAGVVQFSMATGNTYFLEIAKIRAFKLLWLNVLKGWNAPLHPPVTEAYFHPESYSGEPYTNMIRATTMAMSAVLGGTDRLTVLPYDAGVETQATNPPAFGRRIARNVQHLLKMESFFSAVPDPAAGSYYVEKLTQQIAERAWEAFQNA